MKQCTRCNETKLVADFPRQKGYKDGISSWCRTCRSAYAAERRSRPAVRRREKELGAEYRQRHLERVRARNLAHNRSAKRKAYNKAWKRANKAKVVESANRYRANHPEYNRIRCSTRYARLRNAPVVDLTQPQWLEVLEEFNHRCGYCLAEGPLQMEHMTPLSRGGSHTRSNVIPACPDCNYRKHKKTLLEFTAQAA